MLEDSIPWCPHVTCIKNMPMTSNHTKWQTHIICAQSFITCVKIKYVARWLVNPYVYAQDVALVPCNSKNMVEHKDTCANICKICPNPNCSSNLSGTHVQENVPTSKSCVCNMGDCNTCDYNTSHPLLHP
jgi:hypothetical protein